ncbi:hypothetical protein [Paenibacillus dendrobii]|nr:hypothetical protein [Paenibacillus dendrobii]
MLVAAFGCAAVWISSGHLRIDPVTVGAGLCYGIDFALTMIVYARALATGPLTYSAFCFSASMLIPVAASHWLWNERISHVQVIGITMFLISFYCILVLDGKRKTELTRPDRVWYLYALAAFVCNGLLSVFAKYHQTEVGEESAAFLGIGFLSGAAVTMIGVLILSTIGFRRERLNSYTLRGLVYRLRTVLDKENLLIIAGIASATGFGNGLVVWMTSRYAGANLFPAINGSVIIGLLMASRFLYGERLSSAGWIGAFIGVAANIPVSF